MYGILVASALELDCRLPIDDCRLLNKA